MGDQAWVATQIAALLRRPAVLTAIGAALAPFIAGAPPATVDEGAARGRSDSKGRKGGGGSAQAPPPPPSTAEQAMIASLQRQIACLEGVINSLCRELEESRRELAPKRPKTAAPAPAASTIAAARPRPQRLLQGGCEATPTVATLLHALHRSKTSLAVPGTSLQGVVRTEHPP